MLAAELEQSTREVVLCHHHHTTTEKALKKKQKARNVDSPVENEEAFDVLVGSVAFLPSPIACFVRLERPCDLGEMTEEEHKSHVR
jgi:hypothetical protein